MIPVMYRVTIDRKTPRERVGCPLQGAWGRGMAARVKDAVRNRESIEPDPPEWKTTLNRGLSPTGSRKSEESVDGRTDDGTRSN
jgi:hypothetical protein